MSRLLELWPTVVATAVPPVQAAAVVHVLLPERDVRAAVGWMDLIWLVPLVGALLYGLLGIDRIRRKARAGSAGDPDRVHGERIVPRVLHRRMARRRASGRRGRGSGSPAHSGSGQCPPHPSTPGRR